MSPSPGVTNGTNLPPDLSTSIFPLSPGHSNPLLSTIRSLTPEYSLPPSPLQSEDLVCLAALSSPPPNPDYLFIGWLPAEGDAVAMGTFSPLSGLPLVSVGCSCLSRLQPQEPNPRWELGWGWGMIRWIHPSPRSCLWQRPGRGGAKGTYQEEASGTSAPTHQFYKLTTSLANIPACHHMPSLPKSGCLGEGEEGGTLKIGEEWKVQSNSVSD